MNEIIYIWDGVEYTSDGLRTAMQDSGWDTESENSLQNFIAEMGITIKGPDENFQTGVVETDAAVTPEIPTASSLELQLENSTSAYQKAKNEFENLDGIKKSQARLASSELKRQNTILEKRLDDPNFRSDIKLDEIDPEVLALANLYDNYITARKQMKDSSSSLKDFYYDPANMDINNPKTLVNQTEEAIFNYLLQGDGKEGGFEGYKWLALNESGARNAITFYIDGKHETVDLKNINKGEEGIKTLNRLKELNDKMTREDIMRNSFSNLSLSLNEDVDAVNKLLENTKYRVKERVEVMGPTTPYTAPPRRRVYDLYEVEQTTLDITDAEPDQVGVETVDELKLLLEGKNIRQIDKYIRDNFTETEFNQIASAAYPIVSKQLEETRKEIEKEKKQIELDKTIDVDFYEKEFTGRLVSFMEVNSDFTDEDIETVERFFENKKDIYTEQVRKIGSEMGKPIYAVNPFTYNDTMRRQGFSPDDIIKSYKDLSSLPEELKIKFRNNGIDLTETMDADLAAYKNEMLQNKRTSMFDRVLEDSGKQDLINLASRFHNLKIDFDQEDVKEKIIEKTNLFSEKYTEYSSVMQVELRELLKDAPKGMSLDIGLNDNGPIYKINFTKEGTEDFSKEDKLKIEEINLRLPQMLSDVHNLFYDYKNSRQKLLEEYMLLYEDEANTQELWKSALKEYDLGDLVRKDLNDAWAEFLLTVPTLVDADWAIREQKQLDHKNQYFKTMTDPELSFEYIFRTLSQQNANLTVAILTAGGGSALNLNAQVIRGIIGTTFGATSGTQTYRDLNAKRDAVSQAYTLEKMYNEALEAGTISEYNYAIAMNDIQKTKAMDNLTDAEILLASASNAVIEGGFTYALGARNTLKLVDDFKGTNMYQIADMIGKGNLKQITNFIGKPLATRLGIEELEELSIYSGQQLFTEGILLNRDLESGDFIKGANDTFWATLTVAGLSQAGGVTYSGVNKIGATKKYQQYLNKNRINQNEIIANLNDPSIDSDSKKALLYTLADEMNKAGVEFDKQSLRILNLGSEDINKLLVRNKLRQDFLLGKGILPNQTKSQEDSDIANYKATLKSEQKKQFDKELNGLDGSINEIKNKIDSNPDVKGYDNVKTMLGDIYTTYDQIYKDENNTDYLNASTLDQLTKIIHRARQDFENNYTDIAKENFTITEYVENVRVDKFGNHRFKKDGEPDKRFKPLDDDQKNKLYAEYGKQFALQAATGFETELNVNSRVQEIFGDGVPNLQVVEWTDQKDLIKKLTEAGLKPGTVQFTTALNKLIEGRSYGFITNGRIFTQNAEDVKADLANGELRAGTVIMHEMNHAIDDARMNTEEGKKKYAENLYKAFSDGSNYKLMEIHMQVTGMLDQLYTNRVDENGKAIPDLTFENSQEYRDEYTKYVQEHAYAYENIIQKEKSPNKLLEFFDFTNANNLNTPEKALNYMLGNNAAFRAGKLSSKSMAALKKGDHLLEGEVKPSEKNVDELAVKFKSYLEAAQKGQDLDMSVNEIRSLQDQYTKLSIDAIKKWAGYKKVPLKLGNPQVNERLNSLLTLELPKIINSYDPKIVDGKITQTLSTYLGNVIGKRIGPKLVAEWARVSKQVQDSKIPDIKTVEQKEFDSKDVDTDKVITKIDPRKLSNVGPKLGEIESVVDIKPEEVPISDFKRVSDVYGTKVASIIYGIPENKLGKDDKNITYADYIINPRTGEKIEKGEKGIQQKGELGRIQQDFKTPDETRKSLRLLPTFNVSPNEAIVNEKGERIPISKDIKGRSLGLSNNLLNFFYTDAFVDPRALSSDFKTRQQAITTPKGRSKGSTSQVNVRVLKPEFGVRVNDQGQIIYTPISNATVQKVQNEFAKINEDFSDITDPKLKLQAIRNLAQNLKGWANLKGSIVANTIIDKQIDNLDLRTAKPIKQIKADLRGGRSEVQFSDKVTKVFDLGLLGRSKVNSLLGNWELNPTLDLKDNVLTVDGRKDIVDSFREVVKLGPREMWIGPRGGNVFTTSGADYGISMSPTITRGENKGKPNPRYNKKKANALTQLRQDINDMLNDPSTEFGAKIDGVNDFKISSYGTIFKGTQAEIKDKADIFNDKIGKIHETLWQRIAEAIRSNKSSAVPIATYLKLVANHTGHWHKMGAQIFGYSPNPKGIGNTKYEYEHAMPATSAYLYLLDAALNKDVDFDLAYDYIIDNYKVIALDAAENAKLGKAGLARRMPVGWEIIKNTWWQRYFNPAVAKIRGGINPSSIVDLNGDTLQNLFRINPDGSIFVGQNFKPTAQQNVTFNNKGDKAMADARNSTKYSQKVKKARVFDFDDTIATSKSMVRVTMPDGTKTKLNATEFAKEAENLMDQGAEFDFTEFNKVIDGKKGPLFKVAKAIQDKRGSEDIFILTARPQSAAVNIKMFLEGLGLNIPLNNITGLEDGRPKAKADWFVEKYSEGYNDFYFADDALKNVKAVQNVFNTLDIKGRVQQARVKFSDKLDVEFNKMIERNKGVKAEMTYSDVLAKRKGRKQKRFAFFIPPSADDFRGLTMYTFAGKGKQGEADQDFFDKALIKPYMRGVAATEKAKQRVRNDYRVLLSNHPDIRKKLNKKIGNTDYTLDEAIRIYLWTKNGYEIPGLSKTAQKELVKLVSNDADLVMFAEGVKLITRKDQYMEPSAFWDGSTIIGDLNMLAREVNRTEYLKEFIENVDIIFSKKNLNKIEAIYGFRVREALEDSIYRMKTGSNRKAGSGRIVNEWNDWVNNSVGAIMFFNRRSALLQTISSINFVNWSDNNPLKAAMAFANQPQYWKDVAYLFNSDKLKQRRRGLQSDIQEAEIAAAAKKGGMKGVISYLLKVGFTPTQLADSIAIATGGASFYRNRINTYQKAGYDQKVAEEKAFEDFSAISDETQQSADPMLISSQQASVLGRLVLAFQNTPMQYTRLIKKAGQDLINRRGDDKTNISKIVYYAFVQNLIFSTLQNALFALLPGFDDEEQEFATDEEREKYFAKEQRREDGKTARTINSMIDTLLRGSGLAGAVTSTLKNVILEYYEQQNKTPFQRENADILIAAMNISPPIGSKVRKLNNFLQTEQFEADVISERGFDVTIDGKFQLSPSYDMVGELSSALLNLPLDRAFDEVNAITEALDTRNSQWQRLALWLGWRQWDVNARVEEHDLIKTLAKEERKKAGIEKSKITREKNKKEKEEYNKLRMDILLRLPQIKRDSIYKIEEETNLPIPKFKLEELAEKMGI